MPWDLLAKKDVVGNEMPWGAVKRALIHGCPNGETRYMETCNHPTMSEVVVRERTQGTETSKYL